MGGGGQRSTVPHCTYINTCQIKIVLFLISEFGNIVEVRLNPKVSLIGVKNLDTKCIFCELRYISEYIFVLRFPVGVFLVGILLVECVNTSAHLLMMVFSENTTPISRLYHTLFQK